MTNSSLKILVFTNGYHGSTILFLNRSLKHTTKTPYEFVIAPYNDTAGADSFVKALPPNSLAAILIRSRTLCHPTKFRLADLALLEYTRYIIL